MKNVYGFLDPFESSWDWMLAYFNFISTTAGIENLVFHISHVYMFCFLCTAIPVAPRDLVKNTLKNI